MEKDENDRFVGKVINYNEVNKNKMAEEEEAPKHSLVTASIMA